MSGFLLDTNCISELVSPKPEPRVIEWVDTTDEALLYLSALSVGEIRKGIDALPDSRRRTRLETWLEVDLKARFAGRILPIDAAIAGRWGALAAAAKRIGKALAIIDGLIAATALHHDLAIVTRNTSDFATTHARVLNPWESRRRSTL